MDTKADPLRFYRPEKDGVTFSLLQTFLDCREKARLFLEGWSGGYSGFALVFGSISHRLMQTAYGHETRPDGVPNRAWVETALAGIEAEWKAENPRPHEKAVVIFNEAMMKALAIYPTYFRYWKEDFNPKQRVWLDVEQTFNLPWGQTFLRGRMDATYRLPSGAKKDKPRLFETKTRTNIDELEIVDTMPMNRQLNIYLSALRRATGVTPPSAQLNLVRKPALRQGAKETYPAFVRRIEEDVKSRMDWYFMRMEMSVDRHDIDRNEKETNDLIADFLAWYDGHAPHYKNDKSCYLYHQPCPYLKVCAHGDFTGLTRREVVFSELEQE